MAEEEQRVYAVVNIPPEIDAYSTVRFSRSPDSKIDSINWIYRQSAEQAAGSAEKFFDSYYFQYGHGSIADCGHVTMAIEQYSQLMAEEIEDEPLWDGQEQSTRYQDFSQPRFWMPHDWSDETLKRIYQETIQGLFQSYRKLADRMFAVYAERNPKPEAMKQDAYERTIKARAFDVARYLLPMATLTNVGQITSIRTLEKQIQRLLASRHPEIKILAYAMKEACKKPAYDVAREILGATMLPEIAAAPTLAKYLEPDVYLEGTRKRLNEMADSLLPKVMADSVRHVDLVDPDDYFMETIITALYWVSDYSYRQVQQVVRDMMNQSQRKEVWNALFADRDQHHELLWLFRGGYPLIFDICVDIGADRDLKRHRRCIKIRQDLSHLYGCAIPPILMGEGLTSELNQYIKATSKSNLVCRQIAQVYPYEALYVLPLGFRRRRLYKMDPAELCYIAELRTGVKGHFSYREAAYRMYELAMERYPELKEFEDARVTHPSVEDTLTR